MKDKLNKEEHLTSELIKLRMKVSELEASNVRLIKIDELLLKREEQLNSLIEASHTLNSLLDVPTVMRRLVASAMKLVDGTSGTAGLLLDGKIVFSEYNEKGHLMPIHYSFDKGCGVPGQVFDTMLPYVTNDAENDPCVIPEIQSALNFRNLIDVPIINGKGEFLGCFEIHNKKAGRTFDEDDIIMLQSLADSAALAIDNAKLFVECRKSEDALRESEKYFRSLVETSAECICNFDLEGNILYMSPAGLKCHNLAGNDVRGLNWKDIVKPSYHASIEKTLEKARCGEVVQLLYESELSDGTRWFDSVLNPIKDDSGKTITLLCISRDVTDRKELEEQAFRSQKMEAIGRLAGGIAHDFNNLLTTIIGNTELLLLKLNKDDPNYSRIETIRDTGERAAKLTSKLLAFSRKQVFEPVAVNLNEVIKGMTNLLKRLTGEDVVYSITLNPELKKIKADISHLEQVILNLVVNAREAMPEGGKISIVTDNIFLDEKYCGLHEGLSSGDYVLLSVSDTGSGISDDIKNNIFDPFFTTKASGTGLGLSTVYGIVKECGGHIDISNKEEQGTTFNIYLPVCIEGSQILDLKGNDTEEMMPRGRETLLIVEDEEAILDLIVRILKGLGYNILRASGGKEAFKIVKGKKGISLLLTDVILQDMRGTEVAEKLKKRCKGLKVLFMSGYTDDRIANDDIREGRVNFIPKPFTPLALAKKVREVLDG